MAQFNNLRVYNDLSILDTISHTDGLDWYPIINVGKYENTIVFGNEVETTKIIGSSVIGTINGANFLDASATKIVVGGYAYSSQLIGKSIYVNGKESLSIVKRIDNTDYNVIKCTDAENNRVYVGNTTNDTNIHGSTITVYGVDTINISRNSTNVIQSTSDKGVIVGTSTAKASIYSKDSIIISRDGNNVIQSTSDNGVIVGTSTAKASIYSKDSIIISRDNNNVIQSTSNGVTVGTSTTKTSINGTKLIIPSTWYGSSLPSSGETGQVFFKLV